MSKCISSHGEYSEHEPGDPCPWCGEYDMERIIAERDDALARIKAVEDVLDRPADGTEDMDSISAHYANGYEIALQDIRRALDGEQ